MNKKLIALAVAASFAAPLAAQAETTPYANVQFEVTSYDDGVSGTASKKGTFINDKERGQIGLKGSEDLGNGLKAIAKAEFDFVGGNGSGDSEFGKNTDKDTGNALRIREIFAGLSGGFGEIQIGTLKSAYKYTGGVAYDAFVATNLEARKAYGMSDLQNGFINNAIAYKNKFGALGLWVTYSPDETDRDGDTKTDAGETTVGVNFSAGNLEVVAAYYDAALSATNGSYTTTKVGGKFNMGGGTAIMAQYEMKAADAANSDVTNTFVAFHLGMGDNTLVAQYGIQDKDETVASNDSGTMLTIGGIHKFSKNSRVFAGYKKLDGDKATGAKDDTYMSVGLRVDF